MKLTKYLKGLGFDIPQQYAYFGDRYRTTFEDHRVKQDLTKRMEQEMIQRIVQKVTLSHLPFFELIEIKSQQLYFDHFGRFLNPHLMYLDVPKQHLPKLSRLKTHHNFLDLSDFLFNFQRPHFHINLRFLSSFLVIRPF